MFLGGTEEVREDFGTFAARFMIAETSSRHLKIRIPVIFHVRQMFSARHFKKGVHVVNRAMV
jgi:hypothetical protein